MLLHLITIIALSAVTSTGLAENVPLPDVADNYLVAITVNNTRRLPTNDTWYICGGSIIHDRFIVTSASCFVDKEDQFRNLYFTVVAGAKDLKLSSEPTRIIVDIEKVYIPAEYDGREHNSWNNLAVVKLKKSLNLDVNKNIRKLRLPEPSNNSHIGDEAHFAGYGLDSDLSIQIEMPDDKGIYHIIPFQDWEIHPGKVEIVNNSKCINRHNSLCVKVIAHNIDKCLVDTGGPLVSKSDILIGVQSSGYYVSCGFCGIENKYFEFINVADRLDFIKNAMGDKDDEPNMRTHDY